MDFTIQMVFENGKCREALDFYASVFGTKIEMLEQFKSMPELPAGCDPEFVLFATLNIAGRRIMFCDSPFADKFVRGNNTNLVITSSNKMEIENIYHKLQVGGKVVMPLGHTFFSEAFAMLEDKFGNAWQLSCESSKTNEPQQEQEE